MSHISLKLSLQEPSASLTPSQHPCVPQSGFGAALLPAPLQEKAVAKPTHGELCLLVTYVSSR